MKYLLVLLAVFTSTQVSAIVYSWPVVTDVQVQVVDANTAKYLVSYNKLPVDDPSLTGNETAREVIQAHTGTWSYEGKHAQVCIYHRHHDTDGTVNSGQCSDIGYAKDENMKFIDFANKITPKTEPVYHVFAPLEGMENECVGIYAFTDSTQSRGYVPWATVHNQFWTGGTGYAGQCVGVPTINQFCNLRTPSITLDYGKITLSEAKGKVKKADVMVECTSAMKYLLRLQGVNDILLNNDMTAKITANGSALGETLHAEMGLNKVEIASTLQGTPRTGSFAGAGVLMVSYP